MRSYHALLLVMLLTGCSPKVEPDAAAFTLSSGIEVLSAEPAAKVSDVPHVRISTNKDHLVISLREFFYRPTPIERPWLSLPRNGIATLNIGTSNSSELIGNHGEFLQNVAIRVDRKRVPAGTVLSIYNRDTSEVLANHAIP